MFLLGNNSFIMQQVVLMYFTQVSELVALCELAEIVSLFIGKRSPLHADYLVDLIV